MNLSKQGTEEAYRCAARLFAPSHPQQHRHRLHAPSLSAPSVPSGTANKSASSSGGESGNSNSTGCRTAARGGSNGSASSGADGSARGISGGGGGGGEGGSVGERGGAGAQRYGVEDVGDEESARSSTDSALKTTGATARGATATTAAAATGAATFGSADSPEVEETDFLDLDVASPQVRGKCYRSLKYYFWPISPFPPSSLLPSLPAETPCSRNMAY